MHLGKHAGSLLISFGFLLAASCHAASPSPAPAEGLSVYWTATQPNTLIKALGPAELKSLKKASSVEVDPLTGKKTRFDGVLLSDIVDKAMEGMANDRKALIDLVILKNPNGKSAPIPRSFIVKYPVILATSEDHKNLPNPRSIAPWTSKSKTKSEALPLETYFLSDVSEVELANAHQRYGSLYLKSRTEPLALRGEKIFLFSCLNCHGNPQGVSKAQSWSGQHPAIQGAPSLGERDQRALRAYLDLYKSENAVSATASK